MLTEDIKKQLKNEELSKIDIHELAMNVHLNNEFNDFNDKYIDEIIEYIEQNTKLGHKIIPGENENIPLLRIMSSSHSRSQIMMANSNNSLEISIYDKIKTIIDNEDYVYNTRKTLVIYKNPRNILETFKFRYTIFGRSDEREYLNYSFTSLTNDKRNEDKKCHDIYSDITAGNMLPIINEIMINKELTKEFFEVLELTQDFKDNYFESLFEPILNIQSKNEKLKEFLIKKITTKNTMVNK